MGVFWRGRDGIGAVCGAAVIFAGVGQVRADIVFVTDSNSDAGTIALIPNGGDSPSVFASGLERPEGIAFTPSGALYVDNQLSGEIDQISAGGGITPFVTIDGGFVGGMISDGLGNLYVSMQNGAAIDKITPDGSISVYATGVGNPQGLAFDAAGNLYVGSPSDNTIYKVASGGGVGQVFATLPTAVGIAVDSAGNVYAGDADDGYIEEFSSAGKDLGQYAQVATPAGILFDGAGQLLVASSDRVATGFDVYAVAPGGGTVTVYASGLGGPFYLADPLLPGDANGDGKVDLSDLNTVLNHLGETDSLRADGNFDGAATIDLTDLNDVLNNLGVSATGSVAAGGDSTHLLAATPEPASLTVMGIADVLLMWRRREDRSSRL